VILALALRLAEPRDLLTLVHFATAMAQETEGLQLNLLTLQQGIQAVLDDPWKGIYLVAEDQDKLAGALMVTYEWSDWRNGPIWWIQSVYVRPEHRGQGVYDALHAEVLRRAQAAGARGVRLYVVADNAPARRVYERNGMTGGHYVVYEQYFS